MTKEVLISIRGVQKEGDPEDRNDPIEVIVPGQYYFKNNKHYLIYDEIFQGFDEPTKNVVKIAEDCVELSRRGSVSVTMVFEKNKRNGTRYFTPLGSFELEIETGKLEVSETEERIEVKVEYAQYMNHEKTVDCSIHIVAEPASKSAFL